jgi:hypothetical protein
MTLRSGSLAMDAIDSLSCVGQGLYTLRNFASKGRAHEAWGTMLLELVIQGDNTMTMGLRQCTVYLIKRVVLLSTHPTWDKVRSLASCRESRAQGATPSPGAVRRSILKEMQDMVNQQAWCAASWMRFVASRTQHSAVLMTATAVFAGGLLPAFSTW